MPARRSYIDHNATSPLRPEAREALLAALSLGGNASSVHAEGRGARSVLNKARTEVGALVGAGPDRVVFTSGGTEANNAVLRPGAVRCPDGRPATRLVTTAVEHASVLGGHAFRPGRVTVLPVDRAGRVAAGSIREALGRGDGEPTLVSVQVANSETGVLQPVAEAAAEAREYGAAFHADAVQAAGRVAVDVSRLDADALTLSAHKLGGAPGAGALVIRPDRVGPEAAMLRGGGQEHGLRSGTENGPALAAFGAAAACAACGRHAATSAVLRDRAEAAVLALAPDAVIFGRGAPRLPNTLAFAVPGLKAETVLMALDLDGIAVSSGSACSSGKVGRSHVLAAMGIPADLAAGAIRLSFGWSSSHEDVTCFEQAFAKVLRRLYERRGARAA